MEFGLAGKLQAFLHKNGITNAFIYTNNTPKPAVFNGRSIPPYTVAICFADAEQPARS